MGKNTARHPKSHGEGWFRTVFEHAATGIAITDLDGTFERCNPAYCALLGYTEDELRRAAFPALIHPEDREANLAEIRRLLAGEVPSFETENRYVHKSGRPVWVRKWVSLLPDEAGRPSSIMALVTDVTEHNRDAEALRESERRWRDLAEALPQLVWTCAPDGRCDYLSRQWVAYTGKAEAEQLGYGWLDQVHTDDRDRLRSVWGGSVAAGTPFDIEFRIRRADGVHRWFKTRAVPVRGSDGRVVRWFGSNTDIEDLKRAADELRASEERLQLMADALPALIAYVGSDGRYLFNNAAFECWFGQSPVAFKGRHLREVLGEEAYETIKGHIEGALAGQSQKFESAVPYQGAGTRDVLVHYVPHRDPGGRVLGFFALIVDLTEQKRAEEAVRRGEERLRAILNTAADAIITIDGEGTIQSVNPAAERMFGYAAAEMAGRNVGMLMPSPHREEHDRYLADYLRTRVSRVIGVGREVEAVRKDGTVFPVELAVSEVDHLPLFTWILHDLTRRKELEREVVEIASLEQRRIGQDLHDSVAQELTALNLLADDLAEVLPADPAGAGAMVARIAGGLRRSQEQLRAVMRGLVPVAVDAGGLMAALADLADRTGREGGPACTFDCPAPVSVADNVLATQLYLIAQEAVRNAVKHARPRAVRITLRSDGHLTLQVRDDGVGMPARPTEIQGLGLRIMRNRATIIGAVLTIGRAEPTGTVVTCVLARRRDEQQPTGDADQGVDRRRPPAGP